MTTIVVMAITGAGLITGLLFAFSNCVLRALADLPNDKGMFAMQRVNEKIQNPLFLFLFLGTPILCAVIAFVTARQLAAPDGLLLFTGALAYLVGPFGITVLFNVPLNNRLAAADRPDADAVWPAYQKQWQRWNHARTYIGVVAVILLAAGLAAGDA